MKTLSKLIVVILILASSIFINSCGKYDEGPGFSLRTKKARLTGEWEIDEINGRNVSSNWTIEFKRDKTFVEYEGYGKYKGDWEWEDNKEVVELDYDDGDNNEFEILRLTNKELWVEDKWKNEYYFKKDK